MFLFEAASNMEIKVGIRVKVLVSPLLLGGFIAPLRSPLSPLSPLSLFLFLLSSFLSLSNSSLCSLYALPILLLFLPLLLPLATFFLSPSRTLTSTLVR